MLDSLRAGAVVQLVLTPAFPSAPRVRDDTRRLSRVRFAVRVLTFLFSPFVTDPRARAQS
jgi:hypothetical protein